MPDRQQTAPGVVLFDGTTGQNFGNSNLSAAGRDHINLSINLATGGAGHQYSSQTPESATSSPPLIVQGSERPAQDPSLFTRVYRSFCHRSRRRPRSNGQDLHEPENVPQYPRIEVTQHDRPVPGLSSPSPSPVVTLLSDGGSITSFDNYSQSVRIGISNEEEVFERCLLPKGHGYPMFNPRPLRGPVKFGDYGILGPDGFDSFGNLYNPENQQELSISHIPEPFITSQPEKLHEGQIISTGIEDARQFRTVNQNNVTDMFEFHCRQTQGAVLAVTSSGELETLTPKSRNQLRKYLCKHGSHLMATLRREDYLEPGQSLYVVTGTIKSSSWAIAVHTSLMQKPFDQVVLTRREDKSGASFPTYTWTSQGSAAARSVASVALDEEGGRIKDQCLFLRGFLLTPSLDSDLVQRRNPSSGSNSSAGDSGSSPGSTDSHNSSRDGGPANSRQQKRFPEPNHRNASLDGSFPHQLRDIFQPFGLVPPFPVPTSNSKHYYPSRRINDVLLEDESVNLAITHDDDWQVSLKILDGYLDGQSFNGLDCFASAHQKLKDEAVSALMTAVWENNISTVSNGVATTVPVAARAQDGQKTGGCATKPSAPTSELDDLSSYLPKALVAVSRPRMRVALKTFSPGEHNVEGQIQKKDRIVRKGIRRLTARRPSGIFPNQLGRQPSHPSLQTSALDNTIWTLGNGRTDEMKSNFRAERVLRAFIKNNHVNRDCVFLFSGHHGGPGLDRQTRIKNATLLFSINSFQAGEVLLAVQQLQGQMQGSLKMTRYDDESARPSAPPPKSPYVYRPANGSAYNPLSPAIGMAGTSYARNLPSRHTLPKDSLPDPDLVFDTLLKRDKFEPHPGGMSALFFAFAELVIHSIFKTNRQDWSVNDASSYLDLSVLYGHNDTDVEAIRRKDGTGALWNDVFADSRLTHMPPASCALLVLLSRNHNYVAQKILDINENGKYRNPSTLTKEECEAQDLEIFHRTRLVNCGYFMHIILGDYVGAILGLIRERSDSCLDPMTPIRNIAHEFVAVGEGNVRSIEFNLVYRWHSTLSAEDTEWTEKTFKKMFGNDVDGVNDKDFNTHTEYVNRHLTLERVREWTFAGLKRGTDGRFSDGDLARLIQNSIECHAGAFKACGIPVAMRAIEVMGIKQSRTWGTCSLNEFRKFMGLKPYNSFKEWNPDPKIHNAAQALYRDIENLELHVGLQAEEAKSPTGGTGLCSGHTVSLAVLADAVCLVQGDRFFTNEYNPANLTAWGFQDCQYNKADGAFGGMLGKLLLRTLPDYFPRGSAYAHFPFLVPSYLEERWKKDAPEIVAKYTWNRPRKQPPIISLGNYEALKRVSSDTTFISACDIRLKEATKLVFCKPVETGSIRGHLSFRSKRGSMFQTPAGDKKLVENRDTINDLLVQSPEAISAYFAKKTKELIQEKRFTSMDGKTYYVDVVRDVLNLLPVHFVSQKVAGLPLKCKDSPQGEWHEAHVSAMLEDISEYIYLNFSPEHDWRLHDAAQAYTADIVLVIKSHVDRLKSWFGSLSKSSSTGLGQNGHDYLEKVVVALRNKDQSSGREIATQIVAAVVPSAALYASALAQIVNFFLQESNAEARERVLELSKSKEAGASSELMDYVREALRLNPVVPGFYRTAAREVIIGSQCVQAFEVVYGSLYSANRDPEVYGPCPEVPVYNRLGKEPILGLPQSGLTSDKFIAASIGPILAEILSLKSVQLTPNNNGRLNGFQELWHTYPRNQYLDGSGGVSQFPVSLMMQYKKA